VKRTKRITSTPYSVLAQIYDVVMDHVNYEQWANYISYVADIHGQTVVDILDISCGTGSLCFKLKDRGYSVYGCDLSLEMVWAARAKKTSPLHFPCFYCADLRQLSVKQPLDMVVCLYDSMNYLDKLVHWEKAFNDIYSRLKPNGLFVFDVSTIHNSRTFFKRHLYRRSCQKGSYTRRSTFDEKTFVQHNIFEIRLNASPDAVFVEHHMQVIRPLNQIHNLIQRSAFQPLACYSDFSFRPGSEESKRVHFVLKK